MKSLLGFSVDMIVVALFLSLIYWLFGSTTTLVFAVIFMALVVYGASGLIRAVGFKQGLKLLWDLQANSWYLQKIMLLKDIDKNTWRNIYRTAFGIAYFALVFAGIGWLFNAQAAYVAIAIWFACLTILYIWCVREYGFKHSITIALYFAGFIPELKKDIKDKVTFRIKD